MRPRSSAAAAGRGSLASPPVAVTAAWAASCGSAHARAAVRFHAQQRLGDRPAGAALVARGVEAREGAPVERALAHVVVREQPVLVVPPVALEAARRPVDRQRVVRTRLRVERDQPERDREGERSLVIGRAALGGPGERVGGGRGARDALVDRQSGGQQRARDEQVAEEARLVVGAAALTARQGERGGLAGREAGEGGGRGRSRGPGAPGWPCAASSVSRAPGSPTGKPSRSPGQSCRARLRVELSDTTRTLRTRSLAVNLVAAVRRAAYDPPNATRRPHPRVESSAARSPSRPSTAARRSRFRRRRRTQRPQWPR